MNIKKIPLEKYFDENDIKAVVLHIDLGTEAGTISHLQGTVSASYHAYIPKHAKYVIEFVPMENGAWHAGVVHKPTDRAKELFGDQNPNKQSFGLCYEGRTVNTKATDAQVKLAKEYLKYKGLQDKPLITHQEITQYKPMIVHDFKERLESLNVECGLANFTTKELIDEVIRRFKS